MTDPYDAAGYFKNFLQDMLNAGKSFDYTKSMKNFDFSKASESSSKNLRFAAEVNKMVNEKAQRIMGKQSEMFQENVKNVLDAMQGVSTTSADSQKLLEKQNALYQQSMKRNTDYAQQLADMYTETNMEVFKKCTEQMKHMQHTCSKECGKSKSTQKK